VWTCPVPGCGLTNSSYASHSKDQAKFIRTHLVDRHDNTQNAEIPDSFFIHHDLHPCRFCNKPQRTYLTAYHLRNHQERAHKPSTRPKDELNTTLLASIFQTIPSLSTEWSSTLPWLETLDIRPPPFRVSHYARVTGDTRKTAHDVYGLVLQLVTKATPTLSESYLQAHPETPQHERSATPFWKLVFLFEALIFQPQASATKLKKNVTRRLKLFAAGHIKELYEEMLQRPRSKPSTVACQADIDEWNELTFQPVEEATFHQHNPNAQRAANRDNLQTAFRSTDRSLPVAMNTDATIQAIQQKLYPPPVADCPHQQEPTRRLASMPRRRLLPKDTDLIAALKHIKTGTAPGPFADSTDLIRSFALEVQHLNDPDKEAVYPNL